MRPALLARVAAPLPVALERRLGPLVAALWIAFVVSAILFEPLPAARVDYPLWSDVLGGAFWLALLAAGFVAVLRKRSAALSLSLAAAALGVGLGFACAVTDHHTGFFPVYGIGTCATLAWLSAAALRSSRHRTLEGPRSDADSARRR